MRDEFEEAQHGESDETLALVVMAGSPADSVKRAFEILCKRLFPEAMRVARKKLLANLSYVKSSKEPEEDACSVANYAMYKLSTALARRQYDVSRDLRPFFFTIVRNEALNFIWRRHCEQSRIPAVISVENSSQLEALITQEDAQEVRSRVMRVLDSLCPRYRDLLRLRFLEGLHPREISSRMNLSVLQVYRILHRAKQTFKKQWEGYYGKENM